MVEEIGTRTLSDVYINNFATTIRELQRSKKLRVRKINLKTPKNPFNQEIKSTHITGSSSEIKTQILDLIITSWNGRDSTIFFTLDEDRVDEIDYWLGSIGRIDLGIDENGYPEDMYVEHNIIDGCKFILGSNIECIEISDEEFKAILGRK